jgi:type VI secretion system protein VasI
MMRWVSSVAVILVSSWQPSFALEVKEVAKCSAIKDSVKRLECFDDLSARIGVSRPLHKESQIGAWRVKEDVSRVDDSTNVLVSLGADSDISGALGEASRPTLNLRCKEKKLDAYVVTDMAPAVEYGLSDQATATIRFDKDKATSEVMDESTDHNALFFKRPTNIIAMMFEHQTLLFQFTPFNSSPVITTFNLTGAKQAVHSLEVACDVSGAFETAAMYVRLKSLVRGTPIELVLKDGVKVSGVFSSYDELWEGGSIVYIETVEGKEGSFKGYTNAEIAAVASGGKE